MLKINLKEAWQSSQSLSCQASSAWDHPADIPCCSQSKNVLPSGPECVRLHRSLHPIIQQQWQAVDPREVLDELKMPMTQTRFFLFWPLFLMTHLLLAATHTPSELACFSLGNREGGLHFDELNRLCYWIRGPYRAQGRT